MTGYEIYDEGYEAGYESAMEDLMEAMEYTGDAEAAVAKMRERFKPNSPYALGRQVGINSNRAFKYADKKQSTNNVFAAASYQKKEKKYRDKANDYRDRASHVPVRDNNGSLTGTTDVRFNPEFAKGQDFGKKYGGKRYHKKANEALFDFDDIDHAYLDDEYDDFDYE